MVALLSAALYNHVILLQDAENHTSAGISPHALSNESNALCKPWLQYPGLLNRAGADQSHRVIDYEAWCWAYVVWLLLEPRYRRLMCVPANSMTKVSRISYSITPQPPGQEVPYVGIERSGASL